MQAIGGAAGVEDQMDAVRETMEEQQEINDVLVEAGPTLAGSLAEAGCVDEYLLYMAPMLIGDTGRGLVHLPGANRLADARPLEIIAVEPVGSDWRIRARPAAADNRN